MFTQQAKTIIQNMIAFPAHIQAFKTEAKSKATIQVTEMMASIKILVLKTVTQAVEKKIDE